MPSVPQATICRAAQNPVTFYLAGRSGAVTPSHKKMHKVFWQGHPKLQMPCPLEFEAAVICGNFGRSNALMSSARIRA